MVDFVCGGKRGRGWLLFLLQPEIFPWRMKQEKEERGIERSDKELGDTVIAFCGLRFRFSHCLLGVGSRDDGGDRQEISSFPLTIARVQKI